VFLRGWSLLSAGTTLPLLSSGREWGAARPSTQPPEEQPRLPPGLGSGTSLCRYQTFAGSMRFPQQQRVACFLPRAGHQRGPKPHAGEGPVPVSPPRRRAGPGDALRGRGSPASPRVPGAGARPCLLPCAGAAPARVTPGRSLNHHQPRKQLETCWGVG